VSDEPIDLWRNDQYTDYSHDVDEDEQGIAWVAGRGGIRGYATSGRHRDPYQNRFRRATPFDPVLVAGGGIQWDDPANPNDDGGGQRQRLVRLPAVHHAIVSLVGAVPARPARRPATASCSAAR
jgi:hypothetical protein